MFFILSERILLHRKWKLLLLLLLLFLPSATLPRQSCCQSKHVWSAPERGRFPRAGWWGWPCCCYPYIPSYSHIHIPIHKHNHAPFFVTLKPQCKHEPHPHPHPRRARRRADECAPHSSWSPCKSLNCFMNILAREGVNLIFLYESQAAGKVEEVRARSPFSGPLFRHSRICISVSVGWQIDISICISIVWPPCAEPHLNRTAGQFAFAPQPNWSALIPSLSFRSLVYIFSIYVYMWTGLLSSFCSFDRPILISTGFEFARKTKHSASASARLQLQLLPPLPFSRGPTSGWDWLGSGFGSDPAWLLLRLCACPLPKRTAQTSQVSQLEQLTRFRPFQAVSERGCFQGLRRRGVIWIDHL